MRLDVLLLRLLFPFLQPMLPFAAEDEGRTEEPTEHKLRKAREEGKVAKSGEFTSALGSALHRPTILPLPGFVARGLLGEMADATMLSSARVTPQKLLDSGYKFKYPRLEQALISILEMKK